MYRSRINAIIKSQKESICKFQSIHTKITMCDNKLYRKKRTIVIKKFDTYGVCLDI